MATNTNTSANQTPDDISASGPQPTVVGVVQDPSQAIYNAQRDPSTNVSHSVFQWNNNNTRECEGTATMSEELLPIINSIHCTFKDAYVKSGNEHAARQMCANTVEGNKFKFDYPRFFLMITDISMVTIPQRMDLVVEMVVVTEAMRQKRITESHCRAKMLELASRDMQLRNEHRG